MQSENDSLKKVGKGTPMGELMRRYWHPIALSSQVAESDSDPLTTWLLGERFVVFRDTAGKVGVLKDQCMHRGVSLGLGRVEEGGIRCLYHGWKFDGEGNILETPNDSTCSYIGKRKQGSFPVREVSGIIWTYIGPQELEPPFRTFDYDLVPEENREVIRANTKASYIALWEGGVDSSHVGMLHTNVVRSSSWVAEAKGEEPEPSPWDSLAPTYDVEDTGYGYRYVAFRDIPDMDNVKHVRQTPVIMPCMRFIPGGEFNIAILDVPMTDTMTATYQIPYSHTQKIDRQWALAFLGFDNPLYDEESCWIDMDWPHGMKQDRAGMKTNWSGYAGIELEDVAMSLSLREDWGITEENLVGGDLAVIRLRRCLNRAIQQFEAGGVPLGVNTADMTHIVSYDKQIKDSEDWKTV